MARDQLDVLLRVRRVAEDEAKRALVARLDEETAARHRLQMAEARLRQERDIATDPGQSDGSVEAYIAWLPSGRRAVAAAQAAHDEAAAKVTLARAELTLAHAAAEAADEFIEQREAKAETALARKAQAALDEIAGRPAKPAP
jgi:flagellar biosynthesis chaperone FliJ